MKSLNRVVFPTITTGIVREIVVAAPLACLTFNAIRDLRTELGSEEAALRFLLALATERQKPICINLPTGSGSTTAFIPPEGWTQDRLTGWVGTAAPVLADGFGPVHSLEAAPKLGRSGPCPCGSDKKYKRCHGAGSVPVSGNRDGSTDGFSDG